MSTVPHLSAKQLLRLLRRQGFTVKPTRKGWIIEGPGGITSIHESSLRKQDRSYRNSLAQLRRIGFRTG
jgi:hypothetical protein